MGTWVHVVGTGTIGEPLIGLLTVRQRQLGIDRVSFSKHQPTPQDIAKIAMMIERGAELCVMPEVEDPKTRAWRSGPEAFVAAGYPSPSFLTPEAIARAHVIVDCTPEGLGLQHRREWYEPQLARPDFHGAVAQGSEFGFGKPYAYRINEHALEPNVDRFIQVVSCNTHNIAVLLRAICAEDLHDLIAARFTCIRRSSDLSQRGGAIASPEVGKHGDAAFGTHHARDAHALLATLFERDPDHCRRVLGTRDDPKIRSSAVKVPTQYMHLITAWIAVSGAIAPDSVRARLEGWPTIALTNFEDAARVFAFGREYGYRGRLYNQTVVNPKTIATFPNGEGTEIALQSFTPQDGNSLLSSVAAVAWLLDPERFERRIECVKRYLVDRI